MTKTKKSSISIATQKKLNIGERIRDARISCGYSQQQVANLLSDKLFDNGSSKTDISAQSISYWENGNYLPSTENLILLSEVLGVSVSSLVEDREPYKNGTKKQFFDIDTTYNRISNTIQALDLTDSINALPYAKKAHDGCFLKNADIPYISHPLNMAAHILAMGIKDDEVIAATLLHDVIEDCCIVDGKVMPKCVADAKNLSWREVTEDDLPVSKKTANIVRLLTCPKEDDPKKRHAILKKYYDAIKKDQKAALIKLVDRCNNISKMSWGLSKERIHRMINETEEFIIPLLGKDGPLKKTTYDNAKYLLSYQIQTTLDIYKRLL